MSLDGHPITNREEFSRAVDEAPIGQEFRLTIERAGKRQDVIVATRQRPQGPLNPVGPLERSAPDRCDLSHPAGALQFFAPKAPTIGLPANRRRHWPPPRPCKEPNQRHPGQSPRRRNRAPRCPLRSIANPTARPCPTPNRFFRQAEIAIDPGLAVQHDLRIVKHRSARKRDEFRE